MIERLKKTNKKVLYALGGGVLLLGFGLVLALSPYLRSMLGMSGLQPGYQESQRFHGFITNNLGFHINETARRAHAGENVFDQDMTEEQKIAQARFLSTNVFFGEYVNNEVFQNALVTYFGFDSGRAASLATANQRADFSQIEYSDTNHRMWDTYMEEGNRILIVRVDRIEGSNVLGNTINIQNMSPKFFKVTLDSNEQLIRNVVLLSNYTGRTLIRTNEVGEEVIDRTGPTITVSYTDPTEDGVTVTLIADREINLPEGWNQTGFSTFTRTFTENTTQELTITDTNGNTAVVSIIINTIGADMSEVEEQEETEEE